VAVTEQQMILPLVLQLPTLVLVVAEVGINHLVEMVAQAVQVLLLFVMKSKGATNGYYKP
jgi:hypothetical protein